MKYGSWRIEAGLLATACCIAGCGTERSELESDFSEPGGATSGTSELSGNPSASRGCASCIPEAVASAPDGPDPSEPSALEGGMDGAGSIGIGLSWQDDLFIQQAWLNGDLQFTVYNRRPVPVVIEVSRFESDLALETWQAPASAVTTFSGTDVDDLPIDNPHGGWFDFRADGQHLGVTHAIQEPVQGSGLALVSNQGLNWSGEASVQVETPFVTAPGGEFTLTLAVPFGGTLTLEPESPPVEGLPFVDIVRVHAPRFVGEGAGSAADAGADGGTLVPITAEGFIVDATKATPDLPVLIDVDVALPSGFSGPFVGFDAWYCSVPIVATADDCGNGGGVTRGFEVADAP